MRQLFIADLHLESAKPQLEQLFEYFMKHLAPTADELYVLGDLFEVWIGDDAINDYHQRIIERFAQYSEAGGKLYFLHGNRDFLLGEQFAKLTGGKLLDEPIAMTINQQSTIVMHGDALCIDDHAYMEFRKQVRTKAWQAEFLAQPIAVREQIARGIRDESTKQGQSKSMAIMDVNQQEVVRVMQAFDAKLLIHGHTHRQNRHFFTNNGDTCERIVLGDWGKTGSVLIVEHAQDGQATIELQNFTA